MLKDYFDFFFKEMCYKKTKFTNITFWNGMMIAGNITYPNKPMPPEIISLVIVRAIEDIFTKKYKPHYIDGELDVILTGALMWGSHSPEEEIRFSIIWDFSHHCSRSEAIQVVNHTRDICDRYEKLFPFI